MKSNKFALFLLMAILFITMGGVGLIIPIMPSYIETFGGGGQVIGFLVALFALGQFIFSPIAGTLSDKIGRKPLIIVGLTLYGISNIMFGAADAMWVLFVARFLSGVGAAFTLPPIMAFVADVTSVENRGKGMALMGASISLGFTIGPALGGILSSISLTFPLFFSGGLSLLFGFVSIFALPSTKKEKTDETVIKVKNDSFFKQLALSTKKSYFSFLVVSLIFCFGISNFQSTASIFLDNKFGYSPTELAMVFTLGGIFGVVLQVFIVEKLFKKFGEENVMVYSLLFAALGTLLMVFVNTYFLVLVVSSLFFIATTFTRPAINTLISKNAEGEQGYAAGVMNAYMSLGTMIGPLVGGSFFEQNMNMPFYIGASALFICFITSLLFKNKKKNVI